MRSMRIRIEIFITAILLGATPTCMAKGSKIECSKLSQISEKKPDKIEASPKDQCLMKLATERKDVVLCKEVSKAMYADCLSGIALAKDDPNLCMKLPRGKGSTEWEWAQGDCIMNIARKRKDRSVCKKLPEGMALLTCSKFMIIPVEGDPCSSLPALGGGSGDVGGSPRADCYGKRAEKEKNPSLCENNGECGWDVNSCYGGAAAAMNDPKVCSKIPVCPFYGGHKMDIARCIEHVATKNLRPELCKELDYYEYNGYCTKFKGK